MPSCERNKYIIVIALLNVILVCYFIHEENIVFLEAAIIIQQQKNTLTRASGVEEKGLSVGIR